MSGPAFETRDLGPRVLKGSLAVLFILLVAGLAVSYLGYRFLKKEQPKAAPKLPLWVQNPEQFLKEYRQEQEDLKESYGIEKAKRRMLEKGFPTRK